MKLGHYEWDPEKDLIAEGGFAEVFKAKDLNSAERYVALKIYKEAVAKGTSASTNQKKYTLEKEFQSIDSLSHTNIISCHGLEYIQHQDAMGRASSYPIIVMEFAALGTLLEFVSKNQDGDVLNKIIVDVIQGLGYLHSEGIIHRDLKPGNILISTNRRNQPIAKITDFGISRDILTDKTIEQSFTEGVGTPHYMAPEQFYKKSFGLNEAVSERTDIWAIGVILYRLITGELPFGNGNKDYELIRDEIVKKDPDFTKIPSAYKSVIEGCLRKNANIRIASTAELLKLLPFQESIDVVTPATPSGGYNSGDGGTVVIPSGTSGNNRSEAASGQTPQSPIAEPPKKKYGMIIGSLILVIALGVAGFFIYRNSKIKTLLTEAWDHYKIGEHKEAYEKYVKASDYNSARAYYHLAWMTHYGNGTDKDYSKALEYSQKALDLEYEMANYRFGVAYQNGWGVPLDTVKSLEYYQKSSNHIKKLSDEGDDVAQYLLGYFYQVGKTVEKDQEKAFELYEKSANSGNPYGIYSVGNSYYHAIGVEKEYDQARKWYEKGVEINSYDCHSGLGYLYYNGNGVEQDYDISLEYFSKAAENGNLDGMYMTGYIYEYGKGTTLADEQEALWWYRKAGEDGHVNSQNNLGTLYEGKKNYKEAKYWFTKSAHKDNEYAEYNLGKLYNYGRGTEVNYDSANYWFSRSARANHKGSQSEFAFNFFNGNGLSKSYDSAFYWYKKAADQDYSSSQFNLGLMYENGYGCAKDYYKARKWYEKSAEQGYASAQKAIAELYYYGKGLSKSFYTAKKWYLKAANQGNERAQYVLGFMYENGQGGSKNLYTARKWYLKAAKQGNGEAQSNVGYFYTNGKGGPKNYKKAFYWVQKAAKQGNASGQRRLGVLYYYGTGTPDGKSKSDAKYWMNKACNSGYNYACEQYKDFF